MSNSLYTIKKKQEIRESKEYIYHKSLSYTYNNIKVIANTQLYEIGIYCIIEPNSVQLNLQPEDLVKTEKKLCKLQKEGKISDLKFGISITVIFDENGLLKEKL